MYRQQVLPNDIIKDKKHLKVVKKKKSIALPRFIAIDPNATITFI